MVTETQSGDRVVNQEPVKVVRVPLRMSLIRELDDAVRDEASGFETRAELVVEAVEWLLVGMEFREAMTPRASGLDPTVGMSAKMDDTRLLLPADVVTVEATDTVVVEEMVIGLHNRDYPSLWASAQLARVTQHGPIGFSEFVEHVLASAWEHGRLLADLERQTSSKKLTAMFPSNPMKRRGFPHLSAPEPYNTAAVPWLFGVDAASHGAPLVAGG